MKKKTIIIMNVALFLTAMVLILNLAGAEMPTLGKAQFWMDKSEPVCITGFEEKLSLMNIDSCCYGLQMQLKCVNWKEPVLVGGKEWKVNKKCYTGEGSVYYFVNNKAYNYCQFS
jgi:hypothetical protein